MTCIYNLKSPPRPFTNTFNLFSTEVHIFVFTPLIKLYHDVIIAPMMSDTYVYRFREISLRNIGRIAKSIGLMLEFDSERIDLWKQIFLQHLLVNSLHLHRFSMNSPGNFEPSDATTIQTMAPAGLSRFKCALILSRMFCLEQLSSLNRVWIYP